MKLKTIIKTILITAVVIIGIFLILLGGFVYETRYKITDIDTAISPTKDYQLVYQIIGEPDFPYGYAHVRLVLKRGQEIITEYRFDVANDGCCPYSEQWNVEWKGDCAEVTISGEEQLDCLYRLFYNGIIE